MLKFATKKEIFKHALSLREQGQLYNLKNNSLEDTFQGSIDRFCDIAFHLRNARKVLDVGAGNSILSNLLYALGHECYMLDINEPPDQIEKKTNKLHFEKCNIEVDRFPFSDNFFDAIACCQVLEHCTHSHLRPVKEMYRVLKPAGIIEIDVPNAVCFRNRSRILRGKHITWDYKKHYLDAAPLTYKGFSFYPDRHNRDFTNADLELLLKEVGFSNVKVSFLKSKRHMEGIDKIRALGAGLRDLIPSLRKSLIAFGDK